jgi:hypothetical protein
MMQTFWLKLQGAYRSTVLWFNGVILAAMPFIDNIVQAVKDNLPVVSQYLTADILKGAAIFILLANIALRFKTKQDLAQK